MECVGGTYWPLLEGRYFIGVTTNLRRDSTTAEVYSRYHAVLVLSTHPNYQLLTEEVSSVDNAGSHSLVHAMLDAADQLVEAAFARR
jgi:hypothetical protein